MYKLFAKVLAVLFVITAMARPLPVFSMEENSVDLKNEYVEYSTVSNSVYLPSQEAPEEDLYGDDFESATIIEVGVEYTGSKEDSSDVDYFKFVPSESAMYTFETKGSADTYAYIYEEELGVTAFSNDGGEGENFLLRYAMEEGSTYYLSVNSYDINVPYTLIVTKFEDDYAYNGYPSDIEIGKEVSGIINYNNDVDNFCLYSKDVGKYGIEVISSDNAYLSISSSFGGVVENKYAFGSESKYYSEVWLNVDESYYISVTSSNPGTSYKIKISLIGVDDHGHNPGTATAFVLEEVVTGQLSSTNINDFFRLNTDQVGTYYITCSGLGNGYLSIYDADGNAIIYDQSFGTEMNYYVELNLKADEIYYFEIYSNGSSISYSFNVKLMPQDDHGRDLNSATNLVVEEEVSGEISFSDDKDFFRFITDKAGMYRIESSATEEAYLDIYDFEGKALKSYVISNKLNTELWLNANEAYGLRISSKDINLSYGLKVSPVNGNLLANASFKKDTQGWNLWTDGGAQASGERDYIIYDSAPAGYRIDCIKKGEALNNIQLFTKGIKVEAGKKYRFTFRAKAEGGSAKTTISLMKAVSPWTKIAKDKTVTLSDQWKTYDMYFDSSETDDNGRITFFMGNSVDEGTKIYIDTLSFKEQQYEELLKNPDFDTDTSYWKVWTDWGVKANGERDTVIYDSGTAGYRLNCVNSGRFPTNIQLYTSGISVEAGKRYKLTFMARSSGGNSTPIIQLMQNDSPWNRYTTAKTVTIDSDWSLYTVSFKSNTTDRNARLSFLLGNRMPEKGNLYIDSLSLVESPEMLSNPSFDENDDGWKFWLGGEFAYNYRITSEYDSAPGAYYICCTSEGTAMTGVQLYTGGLEVEEGKRYKLTLRAKSKGGDVKAILSLMKMNSPWTRYASYQTVTVGSEWSTYEVYFDCNSTDNNARLTFFLGSGMPAGSELYIDTVSMVEVGM